MKKLNIIKLPEIEITHKDGVIDGKREPYDIINFEFAVKFKRRVDVRIEFTIYNCIKCTAHSSNVTIYVDNIYVTEVYVDNSVTVEKLTDVLNNVKVSTIKRRHFMSNIFLNEINMTNHLGNLFIYWAITIPVKHTSISDWSNSWVVLFTIDKDSCVSLVPASMINYVIKSMEK